MLATTQPFVLLQAFRKIWYIAYGREVYRR